MRAGRAFMLAATTLFVVFGGGCNTAVGPPFRETASAAVTDILKGATRVEVFRVSPQQTKDSKVQAIGGYPILSTGKEQDQAFARRLAEILLGNGVTQNAKKCRLEPGVAYRLWKEKQAVEVLVCFKCDELWPHVVGTSNKGSFMEWQDFDPVRARLLALSKEAFPDDKEIQALPEVRQD